MSLFEDLKSERARWNVEQTMLVDESISDFDSKVRFVQSESLVVFQFCLGGGAYLLLKGTSRGCEGQSIEVSVSDDSAQIGVLLVVIGRDEVGAAGKGVGNALFGSYLIFDTKVVVSKEEGPASLTAVEHSGRHEILEVLVV